MAIVVDYNLLDQAFPYNFELSPAHNVVHVGPSLQKLLGDSDPHRSVNQPFAGLVDADQNSGFNLDESPSSWSGVVVSFRLKEPGVRMTGSFLNIGTDKGVVFAGGISPEETLRLDELGLEETDFAPHDLSLEHARVLAATQRRKKETAQVVADLEEAQLLKKALHRKAHTDPLTQVANRSAFVEALEEAVNADNDPKTRLAVMIVDIDRFKSINDLYGHLAGDETLRAVAGHLCTSVGENGLVARLGGDEFGILIPALPIEQDLSHTIDRIVAIGDQTFRVDTANIEINVTLGVVIQRTETTGNELLRHADIAMYEARRTHKQPVNIFNPTARRNLEIRRVIRRELPDALESNQIDLVYQPEVDLESGLATRLEAFVRWNHPEFGAIDTGMFIDEVERNQMSQMLHRYVLRRATTDALQHFKTDLGPMGISVNLSPLSITNTLPADVDRVLGLTGFPAEMLILEVTEVGGNHDMQRVANVLNDLVTIGVTIAIDDFGTGHSSLKNLSQLPIGALKMDGSFTSSVSTSRKTLELVRATIQICGMLDLSVVAEGVETAEHTQLFRALGFEYGQGFYFGQPSGVAETVEFLGRSLPFHQRRSTDGEESSHSSSSRRRTADEDVHAPVSHEAPSGYVGS